MDPALVKAKRECLAARVRELLDWSIADFMEYQIDAGFEYLRLQVMVDEDTITMLTRGEGLFWTWWRLIWMEQDETFLGEYNHIINPDREMVNQLRDIYRRIHNIHDVRLFPPRTIFESYVKEVVK